MKIIFRKLNQGSFTPMKWSPGGAGAQQPSPPSNQNAGFNEADSHQQVKQDFFQHQDNFDRQQQTFEQENQNQRNVRYEFNYDATCMLQVSHAISPKFSNFSTAKEDSWEFDLVHGRQNF